MKDSEELAGKEYLQETGERAASFYENYVNKGILLQVLYHKLWVYKAISQINYGTTAGSHDAP